MADFREFRKILRPMTDTTLETRRRLEEGIVGSFGGRMRHWGQLALANPLAFVATCTLSAVLAFGYSYVPLHAVKDRKLVRLGSTVIEQEIAISELESEIENLADSETQFCTGLQDTDKPSGSITSPSSSSTSPIK